MTISKRAEERSTHRVAMFVYPNAQILDITGPLEVFSRASRWIQEHLDIECPPYSVELVGEERGPIRTSGGLELVVNCTCEELAAADTFLVTGGIGYSSVVQAAGTLDWLRKRAAVSRRIGSICTGSLILAAAGLLSGRRATTHWDYCKNLVEFEPDAELMPDAIFVRDGNIYTSAGVTAGIDLALAMIEEDWGRPIALRVAQALVVYLVRPGGQSQFSQHLRAQQRRGILAQVELWMLEHISEPLTVDTLADVAGMSARHFTRRFVKEFGATPAAHLADLRIERARAMLESDPARLLKDIARECGFGPDQNMRRAFLRVLNITPDEYRQRFGPA